MRRSMIESGGASQGGRSGPAPRFTDLRAEGVIRRYGRRPAEFYRAIDWAYLRLVLATAATAYIVVRSALGRMA